MSEGTWPGVVPLETGLSQKGGIFRMGDRALWSTHRVVVSKAFRPAGRKLDYLGQRKGWTKWPPRALPTLQL